MSDHPSYPKVLVPPRCAYCHESPPHTIGECPACMTAEDTRAAYLVCRKALLELLTSPDHGVNMSGDHVIRKALTFRP